MQNSEFKIKIALMSEKKIIILREECGGGYEVAPGECLELYQLCGRGSHRVDVRVSAGGSAKVVFVAASEGDVEYDYHFDLAGEYASAEVYGLMVAEGGTRAVVRTDMRHNAPRCHSDQQVRGVASGDGYGLFEGLVYVAPDAQQTEAYQQSRNILLSPEARIQTQPQLEIYADDVKCSHGATVGQMNEEQIYYMRQRGLSDADARRLQLVGFMQEILAKIEDETLRREFEERLSVEG